MVEYEFHMPRLTSNEDVTVRRNLESITAVNSISRTFLHTQKLSGDELFNLDETGHEVWLSGIGTLSFELETDATNPGDQRSVVWVIENTQTGDGDPAPSACGAGDDRRDSSHGR